MTLETIWPSQDRVLFFRSRHLSPVDPFVHERGQSVDITNYHEEVAICVIGRRSTPVAPVAGSERKGKTSHLL